MGGRAEADASPDSAAEVNCRVPALLAAVAQRFIYISTDYVFSGDGPAATTEMQPNPDTFYGRTKLAGERAVLAAQANATIIRTSGLYDEFGTRSTTFATASVVSAADNSVSTPTAVADVIRTCSDLIDRTGPSIVHCVGPHALTAYEFHVLAALRWGFEVVPALAPAPRSRVLQRTIPQTQSVSEALIRSMRPPVAKSASSSRCVIFDTVGALLGGRRWMHPQDVFWLRQETLSNRASQTLTDSEITLTERAYTLNPALPRLWSHASEHDVLVLANNGPCATFERWVQRFDLDRVFDVTVNSERDGVSKPSLAFFDWVLNATGTLRCGSLIDDRPEVVEGGRTAGWHALLTHRDPSSLVDCFDLNVVV